MGQEFDSGLLRPFWLWSLIWLQSDISCGFSHRGLTGLADVLPRWLKFVPPHGTSPLLSVLTAWQLASPRLSKWRDHYRNCHAFPYLPLTITLYHFCHILLATQASPGSMLEEHSLHKLVTPEGEYHCWPAERLTITPTSHSAIVSHLLPLSEERCFFFLIFLMKWRLSKYPLPKYI